jgi:predicted TIM-barrel fold metal-dependent hydrolase
VLIDVHAHHSPKSYTDAMARLTGAQRPRGWERLPHTDSQSDVEKRLELMDEAGVEMQTLSHGIMAPYAREKSHALEAAKICNDGYAELTRRHPDRFGAFVSLPLPHIDLSLREMQRGLDDLGMLGVAMNCSVFERSTAETEFEPLYEELNRRAAVLYFHPCASGICSPMIVDYGLSGAAGTSMEDSVIVLHLIVKQIPTRHPNIKIVISHPGGLIPMLLQRLDHQLPPAHPGLSEAPSTTARRFYYDTVGHGSQAALWCAWNAFGADHLLPGSDYPVLLAHESYRETFRYVAEAGLPEADAHQILHRTAPGLFAKGVLTKP